MGLLALAYTGAGFWQPSYWTDEAATLSAVRREFPELQALLGTVDAVHGAYYFLMFGWTRLFGFSEISLRLPSLIAVALSAVLVTELGRKVAGTPCGVLAAAFLTVLPRTQYVGTDARSYALTVLGAVSASFLLVSIRENPRMGKWVGYGAVGVLTVSLSFYCVFLFIAHAVTVLVDPKLRTQWRGMLAASVGWLAPALYVGVIASRQQFQISWIRPVGPSFPFEFVFLQFFGDGYFSKDGQVAPLPTPGEDFSMTALAILMWTAAAVGAVLCRRHFIVRLALPWLLVPAVAVIGGSLLTGGNYYLPRYLTFELPALALLAAAPVAFRRLGVNPRPGVRWVTVATAAVLPAALLVAAPSYIGQRTEFGRDPQDDFRFSARAVEQLAKPGDAFVLSAAGDLVYQAYPESFKGLADPTLGITAAEWKRIFDQRFDVATSGPKILEHPTVILVEKTDESAMAGALEKLGYISGQSLRGPATTVTRFSLK
jgi:mannosyltransferase